MNREKAACSVEIVSREHRAAYTQALTSLWERSVKKTHHFLTNDEVAHMCATLPSLLARVPVLAVCRCAGVCTGFACLCGRELDMLFVDPDWMGKGVGSELMRWALLQGADTLTVNEENSAARRFYEKFEFCIAGRSEFDSLGGPHPILWMKR